MTKALVDRKPRIIFIKRATIWAERASMLCQTVNLSETGLLLIPPYSAEPGLNLRVDIPLPGLKRPLALPAVLVREGEHEGEYVWGVKFELVSGHAMNALRSFLEEQLVVQQSMDEKTMPNCPPMVLNPPLEEQAPLVIVPDAGPPLEEQAPAVLVPDAGPPLEEQAPAVLIPDADPPLKEQTPAVLVPDAGPPMEVPAPAVIVPDAGPPAGLPIEPPAVEPSAVEPPIEPPAQPRYARPKHKPIDRSAARRVPVRRRATGSQPAVGQEPIQRDITGPHQLPESRPIAAQDGTGAPKAQPLVPPPRVPAYSGPISGAAPPQTGSHPAVPPATGASPPAAVASPSPKASPPVPAEPQLSVTLPADDMLVDKPVQEEGTPNFDDVPEWSDKSEVPVPLKDRDLLAETDKASKKIDSIFNDAIKQLDLSDSWAEHGFSKKKKKKKKKGWF